MQAKRQPVRRFVSVLLFAKMKKARVVTVVGTMKYFAQSRINIGTVLQRLKLTIRLNAAILADTQENNPVYGLLNGVIERGLGEFRGAERNVLRKMFAP